MSYQVSKKVERSYWSASSGSIKLPRRKSSFTILTEVELGTSDAEPPILWSNDQTYMQIRSSGSSSVTFSVPTLNCGNYETFVVQGNHNSANREMTPEEMAHTIKHGKVDPSLLIIHYYSLPPTSPIAINCRPLITCNTTGHWTCSAGPGLIHRPVTDDLQLLL